MRRGGEGAATGGKAWERPGKVRTAPVPVAAPRPDHIQLRLQLTGGLPKGGKDRSSPSSYGTPKGLLSPHAAAAVPRSTVVRLRRLPAGPGMGSVRTSCVDFVSRPACFRQQQR